MVEIPASMVKELRERSGAAMMDCKKALVEAQGDFEKAFEWLRQKGVAVASKKALRTASEGIVVGKVNANGRLGAILEVNCETDFVARNPEFVSLTDELTSMVLDKRPASVDEFLKLPVNSGCVQDLLNEKVAKTGENIVIRRLAVYELDTDNGVIGLYVHALGGKMGALVEFKLNKSIALEEITPLSREIAMHIVSAKPQYISRAEIPSATIENERRIESGKADLQDKKPEIRQKIIEGRVDKLLAERCLLDQPFVKDPSLTVAQYLKQKGSQWNVEITPKQFVLFILGETQQDTSEPKNGSS